MMLYHMQLHPRTSSHRILMLDHSTVCTLCTRINGLPKGPSDGCFPGLQHVNQKPRTQPVYLLHCNHKSEWVEQDEPRVYIALTALPGGARDFKQVRFWCLSRTIIQSATIILNQHKTCILAISEHATAENVSVRSKQNNGGKRIGQGYTSNMMFVWSTIQMLVLMIMHLIDKWNCLARP